MSSCLKIFIFFTSVHGALAGPFPRYSNDTIRSTPLTTTSSRSSLPYSRHEHTVVDLSSNDVPASSNHAAQNADQTDSAASTSGVPPPSAISSVPMATTTSRNGVFSYAPARHNGSQTSGGTTTLTLWTTLPYRALNQATTSPDQTYAVTQRSTSSQLSSSSKHRPHNSSTVTMDSGYGGPKVTTNPESSSSGTATSSPSSSSNVATSSAGTGTVLVSHSSAASSYTGGATTHSTSSSASNKPPVVPFPQTYTFNPSGPGPQPTTAGPAPPEQPGATVSADPVSSPDPSTSSQHHRRPGDTHPTPGFSLPEIVTQRPPQGGPQGSPSSAGVPGITIVPVDPNKVTVTMTVSVPSWTTTVAAQTVTVTA